MIFRHLASGLWKISAYRKEHIERWIKKNKMEEYHLNILNKHGLYTIYLGKSPLSTNN